MRYVLLILLALLSLAPAGCGERRDPTRDDETTFAHTRADAVAVVVTALYAVLMVMSAAVAAYLKHN